MPKTRKINARLGEKYIGDAEIMPWDIAFITLRLAPQMNQVVDMSKYHEVLINTFTNFGFDITQYNITFDIFPRKNKSEWGYCYPIKIGEDCRITVNVTNRYYEYNVLLHEAGHAVHFFNLDTEDVLLNMGINGIISEGFANFWRDLIFEENFYEQFFKDNVAGAEAAFKDLKAWVLPKKIEGVHTILFDQALYLEKPNTLDDINMLYWEKYKSILNLEPYADNPPWAFRVHHTISPIYLHNYFLGDLTTNMLRNCFAKSAGIKNVLEKPKEFGNYLIETLIRPSGTYSYLEFCERISGEPFSLKYFTEDQ